MCCLLFICILHRRQYPPPPHSARKEMSGLDKNMEKRNSAAKKAKRTSGWNFENACIFLCSCLFSKVLPTDYMQKTERVPACTKGTPNRAFTDVPPPEHDPIEYIFVVWPKTLQKTEFTRLFIRGAMWNKKETGTFMIFTQIRLTFSKLYHGYTNKSRLACLSCRYCYCSGHIL